MLLPLAHAFRLFGKITDCSFRLVPPLSGVRTDSELQLVDAYKLIRSRVLLRHAPLAVHEPLACSR